MVKSHVILVLMVLLCGRTSMSMEVESNNTDTKNLTVSQFQKKGDIGSTDLEIHNVLIELTNRIFRPDDSHLLTLIKKGIMEAAMSKPSASIEAGAKKAQHYVTDVTAAYTQAIFHAKTAQEAQGILQRFQDTIQGIVDYAKNGEYTA